jgi:nucleoside-diphosphate-sugar epimerase
MSFIDKNTPVLVTGGSGFIASWIIKMLLDDGYSVHATVRSKKQSPKTEHLYSMAESDGRLQLFEADLLEQDSFKKAMDGCQLVIHTASPFKTGKIQNGYEELVKPALEGTRNVLQTVNETETVKRVVLTSSVVSIYGDAIECSKKESGILTEDDWNTTSSTGYQPYPYSKKMAEREAWDICNKQDRWDLLVINPGFVLGPSLSTRTDSTSTGFVIDILNGRFAKGIPELTFGVVDVRDVAEAHIKAGMTPDASGRHILVESSYDFAEIARVTREVTPRQIELSDSYMPRIMWYFIGPMIGFSWKYVRRNLGYDIRFDNSYSIKDLGIKYRPFKETMKDQVAWLLDNGMVD